MSYEAYPWPEDNTANIPCSNLEWARKKEVIIKLYIHQNLSMRDLIKTMTERYGFKATKRMYHTRFAIWGVYKNTKADMKSRLASSVIEAYRQEHEVPMLSSSEKRKLMRHSKISQALGKEERATLAEAIANSAEPCQHRTGSGRSLDVPACDASNVHTPFSETTPATTALTTSSSEESPGRQRGSHHVPTSPSISLSIDRRASNIELLLSCTLHYDEWQRTRLPPVDLDLNKKFWSDIKSGIYFLKVGSHELAWPLLRNSGEKVDALCEYQPPSLLADIYATISPTNTTVCPQLRIQLLRLFARTARDKLGIKHPISIICHQLQMDSEAETPVRALWLMIDDLEAQPCRQELELQHLKRTLVTLLRRKKDYASGEALALSVISSSSIYFGHDSAYARTAITEYVHILTDQRRWEEASPVCQAVLESGQRSLADAFPDERSVWAMEDMAEICGQLRLFGQAMTWLERAFDGALKVWGPNHSATHISNKVDRVRVLKTGDQPSDLFWK